MERIESTNVVASELVVTSEIKSNAENTKPKQEKAFSKILRDIISVTFWTCVLLKVFVLDIDIVLLKSFFPDHEYLINYKFVFLTLMLATAWLMTKTSGFLGLIAYISFFPFIVSFWKFPRFVYKKGSWNFAFACINAIASSYKSMKYNFITSSYSFASMVAILVVNDKGVLLICAFSLVVLILLAYARRLFFALKPSTMHQLFMKCFLGIRKHGTAMFSVDERIRHLAVKELDSSQLTTWSNNLQMAVIYNRSCLFIAKRLKNYERTGIPMVSYVVLILLLSFQTVLSFAFINHAIHKIDPRMYAYEVKPDFFDFFFYSFNNLIFNSSPDLSASNPVSQTIFMIQTGLIFFLGVIFVSIIFSEMRQRHLLELQEAIKGIEEEGMQMETFIRQEYKFNSIDEAIEELTKVKATFLSFILKMSEGLKK